MKGHLRSNPLAAAAVAALSFVALTALFGGALGVTDPNTQDLARRLIPPFSVSEHPLGTDQLGRDMVSRLVYGARVSLVVGFVTVAIAGPLGTALGLLAGYWGGRLDDIISWLANVQLSFPFVLLTITAAAIFGAGLLNIVILLGLVGWVVYARVIRAQVLSVREREYVLASRAVGAQDGRILAHHILPNSLTPLTVIATFEVARMIVAEAALSFLGVGVEPEIPSWGAMLADGRVYLVSAWWLATLPGLAISVTVLAVNVLGDWLRDLLDPRLRHGVGRGL